MDDTTLFILLAAVIGAVFYVISRTGRSVGMDGYMADRPDRGGRMDITWLTDRIAVGGGIWTAENMANVAEAGITHIIDMQTGFDDTLLAAVHGIDVLWDPTKLDFGPATELFERDVNFAKKVLAKPDTKLLIHSARGERRAPLLALALLGSMGWTVANAMELIEEKRPGLDFVEEDLQSVQEFLSS